MRISLNGDDWLFKDFIGEDWLARQAHQPGSRDRRGWRPATVPGSVQNDLWECGEIPDPYQGRNSLLIEWAPQRTWVYKKKFEPGKELQGKRVRLRFEGVDYQAQFFLNGERLGDHLGMYTPAGFEVSQQLKYGQENLLAVVIEPAPAEQPQIGRTSKVRTHKSRMGYWWDFCPRMVHLGIWDTVCLEASGNVRVEDLYLRPRLDQDFSRGEVRVALELSTPVRTDVQVQASLLFDNQEVASQRFQQALGAGHNRLEVDLPVEQPRLWWPNGQGEQPLYEAQVRIVDAETGEEYDARQASFGFRQLELVPNQAADPSARPYTLVVNGRRIYLKGWNWVPIDALYGVERREKLERLLGLARRANVNLLRVWGGGLIEKESFYELCDRSGILVWQEFIQSSSGLDNTPSEDAGFIRWMAGEAGQIIRRKRNHTSLAIWCGGNELQSGQEQPLDDSHPMLDALKNAVQEHDPDRLWLPTSSSGRLFSYSLENIEKDPSGLHDVHGPWEYQGLVNHYTLYNRATSLLHSEFGVEGITNLKTLDRVIAKPDQSPVSLENPFWFHLGSWWVKEAMWKQVFGEIAEVETLVRATQFMQADGLRYALEADRRRKYQNSGSLPWQFNEPYPMAACTSAVDYYAQPKPVYYAAARAYRPVSVTARFPRLAWGGQDIFEAEVWASSSWQREVREAVLELSILGTSGRVYTNQTKAAHLAPDSAVSLEPIRFDLAALEEDVFFLDLRLAHPEGLLSGNRYIFSCTENLAPLFRVPDTSLEISVQERDHRWEISLSNRGEAAALFVWLQEGRPVGSPGYVYFNDNHFCLYPGESRTLMAEWENIPAGERSLEAAGWNTRAYRISSSRVTVT